MKNWSEKFEMIVVLKKHIMSDAGYFVIFEHLSQIIFIFFRFFLFKRDQVRFAILLILFFFQ